MADSKKYNGSTWEHSLRKLTTATDTFTTLPADIYADGNNATVGLKGNTVQNGTPTPDNPVMPQGTGERTGNLFSSVWEQGIVDATTGQNEFSWTLVRTKDYISIKPNIPYSFSRDIFNGYTNVRLYRADKSYIGPGSASTIRLISGSTIINPMGSDKPFCCFEVIDSEAAYIRFNDSSNNAAIKWLMVEGEYTQQTMPEYEPYGYKIPISSANTTTPVYLGEVETTRQIRKLVLTGDEDWNNLYGQSLFGAVSLLNTAPFILGTSAYSTHYRYNPVQSGLDNAMSNGEFALQKSGDVNFNVILKNTAYTSTVDFKSYLAQQYAAGTPVTVWYVLVTEETAVVNEPLMKIGDYADTVSGITIPTITGADSFDVLTTLKPSEVSLSYTGWHDATVEEWDGSQWD